MKKILLVLLLFYSLKNISQIQFSVYSEISIVTAGAGDELFEAFGHSAIRIKDPVLQFDYVYNYGMFDFNAPNFYSNFTKGKLLYSLGRYPFHYFLESYKSDKRWVKQQVLNLTQEEKKAIFLFLENNATPENATYLYDPFYNNCATKLRDITEQVLGEKVTFNDDGIEKNLSFRELMNNEIHWNTWGSFGINLALGSKLDKKATTQQYMYLPKYVYQVFKNSTIFVKNQQENLVKREDVLLDFPDKEQKTGIFNPLLIFSLFSIFGIFITYRDYKKRKITKSLDVFLLFITGLIGLLIVFLWFFTDHSTTPNNFNFLWAFALNLFLIPKLMKSKKSKFLSNYFLFLTVLLLAIPVIWLSNLQLFPIAVIPLLILLVVRYLYLSISLK